MDRVFSQAQKPYSDVAQVALAIKPIDRDQRHLGILHRDQNSAQVLMLHLEWHHRLRNEAPTNGFLSVDPAIPARRLKQLSAFCRKVWRSNQSSVPYALSPPNDCFDANTGAFLFSGGRLGLTCATFILAVFDAVGLRLVNYDTWPVDRRGDRDWQEKIVEALEKSGAAPQHVAAVRTEIGCARFRPEEVAMAATLSIMPADFEHVAMPSQRLLDRLNREYGNES